MSTNVKNIAGGGYILNDPAPNYESELAKCMRYQYVATGHYGCIGTFTTPIANAHHINMPLPKMRATPTATLEGALRFVVENDTGGSYSVIKNLTDAPKGFGYSGLHTYCDIADTESILGQHGWVDTDDNGTKLILDANL